MSAIPNVFCNAELQQITRLLQDMHSSEELLYVHYKAEMNVLGMI